MTPLAAECGHGFSEAKPIPEEHFENVAYACRTGITDNSFIENQVEKTLHQAALGTR
ncbi:MAG: hypothetical protein IPM82_21780 [Saprospiraceae bacterium]|nr:hypothetical protein [Saprospiraceae bacterium]